MKNIGKVKKAIQFLDKTFPGKIAAYKVKQTGVFWNIYTSDQELYFSEKFKKYVSICRKSFLKDVQVVFCFIPNFSKFSSKSLEKGEKFFNLNV